MRVSQIILDIRRSITELIQALTNRLRFPDNFQCKLVDVADTGTADTEFIVTHNLGAIPTHYIANVDGGFVYDSDIGNWTTTEMKLKCSASNASLRLVIFS